MSDAANPPVEKPDHMTSLPRSPLSLEQVEVVKEAIESVREVSPTVWIAPQAESITLDRGPVVFSTETATVIEFIVEGPESIQVYRYEPGAGGGQWMRFNSARKDGTAAEMLEKTIEDEDYTQLSELGKDGGGPA